MATSSPTNLLISESLFNELYPDLEGYYDFFNESPPVNITKEEFERTYLASKLWRLNNCYTITRKDGSTGIFKMNKAQHIVYARSRMHPRVIILKSRQQGISTFWLVSYFDDCMFARHFKIGLMAQGEAEATTLFERTKFLWDMLDESIKQFLGLRLTKDNTKEISFSNNCTIFIRVSFRSTTLQRLHVSEYGKIANAYPKRAREVKTGTLQALAPGNTGVIESTAEGRNDFMHTWDNSIIARDSGHMAPKDFYPIFLSWLDDPDCVSDVYQPHTDTSKKYFSDLEANYNLVPTQEQINFWIIQYRELGTDIYQEYPATPEEAFRATRDGTYWAKLYTVHVQAKGKVIPKLHDDNLYTDVHFDLGVDDYFVMLFVQWFRGSYRIIAEYINNGFGLTHYLDYAHNSPYDVRAYHFPHDVSVRELGSSDYNGYARSRLDIIREHLAKIGSRAQINVTPKSPISDGIEAVRRMIPNLSIDPKCTYTISCFLNYSKKYDDKLKVFTSTPVHDEYSHGADVLRGIATTVVENSTHNGSRHENVTTSQTRRHGGYAV